MKKLSEKLTIPKLKSIYNYQQAKVLKRGEDTDPTTITILTVSGVAAGTW